MSPVLTNSLLAFGVLFTMDFVWAYYTVACATFLPTRAALMAVGITGLNAVLVLLYVADPWSIVAACAGAFAGTFLSVLLQKNRNQRKESQHDYNGEGSRERPVSRNGEARWP